MYALLNVIGFVNIGALLFFLIRVLGYTANRTSKMTFDREAAAECEKKAKQNFLYAGGCVLIWIALAALMQFC